MATIEILAYRVRNMNEFIAFCLDGQRDATGEFKTDIQGRKITGVLRWLHGREVPAAHFFHTSGGANDPLQLFVAMVQRVEGYDIPWMRRIPGFEDMVTTDGLLGTITQFSPLNALLDTIASDPQLDERFAQGRGDVNRILEAMPREERRQLLATLRGDIGTDQQELFGQVNQRLNISL